MDKEFTLAVQDGIREAIKSKLSGYNSPLDKLLKEAIDGKNAIISDILNAALTDALRDTDFVYEIKQSIRSKLGSLLVAKIGGEIERVVNELKSNPNTRAKITLAIDDIVRNLKT